MTSYRAPLPAEAAELAAMSDELNEHEGDPTGLFTAEKALADVIAPDAPVNGIVAEADGGLVGFALWHFTYECAYAERGGFIHDFHVREAWRGTGVADGLLKAVARDVAAAGGTFMWWAANEDNARARAFYRRYADVENEDFVAFAVTKDKFRALLS